MSSSMQRKPRDEHKTTRQPSPQKQKKNRRLDIYHYNGLTNSTQNPVGTHLAILQSKEDTANIQEQMQDVDMALQMSMAQPEDLQMTTSVGESGDPPASPSLASAKTGDAPLEGVLSTKWKGCWVGRMDDLHRTACGMKSNTTPVPKTVECALLWRYHLHTVNTVPSID
eukprot:gb/GECG01000573.1/.p1 GENE.gb/GECG01000573.1/~~gb/GECG01000573.1/.p1  ORF type:complete len:169 (+),score=16.48 gb/GECG01000573.1/:1-507(+)